MTKMLNLEILNKHEPELDRRLLILTLTSIIHNDPKNDNYRGHIHLIFNRNKSDFYSKWFKMTCALLQDWII